jgi:hypothetical protein
VYHRALQQHHHQHKSASWVPQKVDKACSYVSKLPLFLQHASQLAELAKPALLSLPLQYFTSACSLQVSAAWFNHQSEGGSEAAEA